MEPIFDKEFFMEATAHDLELRRDLVQTFLEDAHIMLKDLETHQPGDSAWEKAAHQLKGSAINMGLLRLSSLAGAAEKNDPAKPCEQHREEIKQAFLASEQELKALV